MCVYKVLQIILIIMKNLFDIFKSCDVLVSSLEVLNATEMQTIRGGSDPIKPKSRPIEQFDDEKV